MRIGLVNLSRFVGGAEREMLDQAAAFRDDYGIAVVAIIDSRNTAFGAMLDECGIAVAAADFRLERNYGAASLSLGNFRRLWRQTATLRAIQKRHALDLLATYSFHSGVVGAVARLSGLQAKLVVGQLMRRDLARGGLLEHLQFLAADAVTYNSNAMRAAFRPLARRYRRPEKVVYSYVRKPGPQDGRKERARVLAECGLSAETVIVGFCGRFFKDKRLADVVEAVAQLNATAPGKFFLLAMGGSADPSAYEAYETEVRTLAEIKCGGCHRFLPFARDPFPLLAACDVLVMPSIEPFGRVLVEAMYLGIPFVAADAGGPREIMDLADPRCGKLVPPVRADLIAAAVLDIVGNRCDERPPVPNALSREAIIGGAVQFYRDVLTGTPKADRRVRDSGVFRGSDGGGFEANRDPAAAKQSRRGALHSPG